MKSLVWVFLVLFASQLLKAQDLYFPPLEGSDWETKSPNELGWCQEQIDELLEFLEESETKAFILLHNGKIVIESYFDGHNQDSFWYWASAGKTIVALLTGIAQEKGFLSIADTTSNILGQGWTSCTPEQEEKITIWHQLTMTSGLDDGVPDNHCTDPDCLVFKAIAGTRWSYHNAPYTLLEEVLKTSTTLTLNQLVNNWLKPFVGMNGFFFKQGFNNIYYSNARSMARFGLLILNNGNWSGSSVISDQSYFSQMVNTSQDLNPSYGYLWWLNGKPTFMVPGFQFSFNGPLVPDAPPDLVVAAGKYGQLINVVPSQGLVWIRMGESPDGSQVPFMLNNQIWRKINSLPCSSFVENPLEASSGIRIYPNPASDSFEISSDRPIRKIQVYDLVGRMVLEENKNEAYENQISCFSIKHLNPGGYLVLIFLKDGRVEREKIIIN